MHLSYHPHLEVWHASSVELQESKKKYGIVAIINRNPTILEGTFAVPFILLRKGIY